MDQPFSAGSLCSTVGDLVAWTKKLSTGGIVHDASYREMTPPMHLASGRPMSYGFGLTVDSIGSHRIVSHGGGINGFISFLLNVPQDSLLIAVLGNTSTATSDAVAMPFIEGETIRERLNRETQFGVAHGVRIACEIAGALHYAHRHGVIHRDIKLTKTNLFVATVPPRSQRCHGA